ncbi:MAG: GAF domain-containing protein [Ardenticatenaceae bacterium]|nr:GAF domain-containing protein [Ardenticatenaceae bacterium]
MQEQEKVDLNAAVFGGVDPVVLETSLYNAFIRHAIDNRGVLTSPRRGRQVSAQLVAVVQQYLAYEANESDITAVATQLAEQGMAIITATQMMRALLRAVLNSVDTAVLRRLNDFQIIFLEKLANAREIVQQRFQETSQIALQRALHAQLEQQITLHDAQKLRNDNLNQILQLNARLSQASDEATLLRDAVGGICQALDITHVTLFEALQAPVYWRVITTTASFLNQGDPVPHETGNLLTAALQKEGEAIRAYQTEQGKDGIAVGIILRVGQHLLGAMVAHHDNLASESYEEYLILVRTFAQNLAALWHNLYLLSQTQQRAHELEILHGRYLDSIWNTPEAKLQARANESSLDIMRLHDEPTQPDETDSAYPLQIGDNSFGQIRIPGIENLGEEERAFVQDLIREMGSALNNAQFVQTTRAYSNQLRLAAEVSRAATTILDQNQLIREVVELIRSRFNLYYVGLFLVDEASNTAVLRAGTGEAGRLQIELKHSQEINSGSMIGTAVSTGEACVAQNVRQAQAFKPNPLLPDTQSELALPLKAGSKVIGALTVQSSQQSAFASETITVLQSLADQLAIAIENASLFAQTEQTLAETNRLYAAGRRIGQATNAYEVYKSLVDFAHAAIATDSVQMIIADPKAPDFLITPVAWNEETIEFDAKRRMPREAFRFADAITHRDVVVIANINSESEVDAHTRALFAQNELHAAVIIPISQDQEWFGTLILAHKTPNAFANAALQSIRTLADQAGATLANQRLLRQTNLLYRIGRALNQAITRDDALELAVQEIQTYTGAFQCRFVLYERGVGSGNLAACSNRDLLTKPYRLPLLGDSAFEWLSKEQKPLTLSPNEPVLPADALKQHVHQFGAEASLLIPAASQQELLGYLAIDSVGGERPFTRSNLLFAQTVVDHLTTQMENIKLLDEALHRAQELITLNQVQSNISRVLDLTLLAKIIYGEVGRLLDNTIFHLALYDQDGRSYEPVLTIVEDDTITLPARTLLPGEPLYDFLNQDKPQLLDAHAPLVQTEKIRKGNRRPQSTLWVPLLQDNKPIGLINVQSYEQYAYGDSDIQLLRSIATQTSLAIANAQLFAQTQQQNEDLRQLDQLKTQFLANMSHELRTPLNSIIGFSRVILKGIDGPITTAQEEDLQSIHSNGQHLLMLINEILDMAKIEAGKMTLNFETVNLHTAVAPTYDTIRGLIDSSKVNFIWNVPEDLPEIKVDPIRLRQILLNLLSNAAKFTEEGEIRLHAYTENDMVHIYVEDTGIGIATEDFDKLFMPFAQVDSSTTRTASGTGLGLPITKWLIEMHGGSIKFTSRVNEGSTFHVILPVQQSSDEPMEIPFVQTTIS